MRLTLWLIACGVGLALGGEVALAEVPMIVAHRGASHDAPENTLAAFELAWKQGADGIEGDFYLTQDRQIICLHDADTKRTTGVKLIAEKSTLDQLRQLEAGRWKGSKFAGEVLPTFEEVLRSVPAGKRFIIELKSKVKIVPVLAEKLRLARRDDISLLIISFDEATVRACKQQLPDVPVHWLTGFKEKNPGEGLRPTADEVAQTFRASGADGVGMQGNRQWIDEAFIDVLAKAGCEEFHIWTVDEPEDARYFRDLGAMGITTNRPALIRQALDAPRVAP